jgi:hypothetical protein
MHYFRIRILPMLILLALIFSSPIASGEEKMLFSGFAFSGNYENRNELYPYSTRIELLKAENGQPQLNRVFYEKIKNRSQEEARLTTELGRLGKGSQVTVAFALTYESVEYMEFQGDLFLYLGINANVLAFDRASKQLIAAYPVRIRYSDRVSHRLSDAETLELFRKLYLTGDLGINAFDEWLDKFSKVTIKPRYAKYLQVKNIEIEPEALTVLAANNLTPKAFKNAVANELESSVASVNNIPIVPWSTGEVVGRVMALRFADGNSFNLTLPAPDYEIDFTVRAFRGTVVEEPSSMQHIFRVLGTIKIKQNDIEKYQLNENIYKTQIVTLAKAYDTKIEEWAQYRKALNEMLYETAKQFSGVDSKWLKESASRGSEAGSAFRSASQIFDQLK